MIVILPSTDDEHADKLLNLFVRQLGKEPLLLGDMEAETWLTASCGSASTVNPGEDTKALLDRADKAQERAKMASKRGTTRVSAWAVGDSQVTTFAAGPGRRQREAPRRSKAAKGGKPT